MKLLYCSTIALLAACTTSQQDIRAWNNKIPAVQAHNANLIASGREYPYELPQVPPIMYAVQQFPSAITTPVQPANVPYYPVEELLRPQQPPQPEPFQYPRIWESETGIYVQ